MNDKAVEIAEELLAVEMLEYHNKNWFGADNKVRSQRKQRLLKELIDILTTVEESDNRWRNLDLDKGYGGVE